MLFYRTPSPTPRTATWSLVNHSCENGSPLQRIPSRQVLPVSFAMVSSAPSKIAAGDVERKINRGLQNDFRSVLKRGTPNFLRQHHKGSFWRACDFLHIFQTNWRLLNLPPPWRWSTPRCRHSHMQRGSEGLCCLFQADVWAFGSKPLRYPKNRLKTNMSVTIPRRYLRFGTPNDTSWSKKVRKPAKKTPLRLGASMSPPYLMAWSRSMTFRLPHEISSVGLFFKVCINEMGRDCPGLLFSKRLYSSSKRGPSFRWPRSISLKKHPNSLFGGCRKTNRTKKNVPSLCPLGRLTNLAILLLPFWQATWKRVFPWKPPQ